MPAQEKILVALDEPVFEIDTEGTVLFATPSLAQWTGRDTGYPFADALADGDRARFAQALARMRDGKAASTTLEVTLASPSGPLPLEVKLAASGREGGKVATIAGWLRDTSMERAKEAAANVQGTHLLDLVEHMTDACVVENAEGVVEMVNTAFCEMFKVEAAPQSLVGTGCKELFDAAAAATDKRVAPIYFPMEEGQRDDFEFKLADGKRATQQSLPVSGDAGVAGRLHIFRSLERKAAQGASTALAAQSQIVEKIARNLAVTLESAGSAIHRAEQLELPGAVLENMRRAEHAAQVAFSEIAGLLDFAQLELGDLKLEAMEFHLRDRIAAMLDNLVPMTEERGIHLRLSIGQDVPEHLVGDGARLMLVLRSLLESGFPTAQGGGELLLAVEPEYTADNQIHLAFRVECAPPKGGTRQKSGSATGQLQLSLARQIVRAMGGAKGKIEVREKKETTIHGFTSVFPFRTARDSVRRPVYATLTALPLLVVSADPEQRKELTELARSWRMNPREADNAAVALQLLTRMAAEENMIPLVITSNQLPLQDGFLLAFRIKHHPRLKQTAVMMLAKSGKPGDAIACRENGISAYLRHPIAANQLNEAISAVVGAKDDDAEATSTLITRHSLREAKAGSVLIVDPHRDHAGVAVGALKKKDYRVVHADTADEAYTELAQDVFDLIILDPTAKGFIELGIEGISDRLQEKFARSGSNIPVLLAVEEDVSAVEFGFAGMLHKPYDKETLLQKVAALIPAKAAG